MKYEMTICEPEITNPDLRFILGTKGDKPLLVFGLNPSTADGTKPDTTISKVRKFALLNGFDSFIMCNLYAQRTPYTSCLHEIMNEELHKKNMSTIKYLLQIEKDFSILAAWGEIINIRSYFIFCLKEILDLTNEKDFSWFKLGSLTKTGHPRHPSRIPYNSELTPFDVDSYLARLQ